MTDYATFSADGYRAVWSSWDGGSTEELNIVWDNEAWTLRARLSAASVEYVLRLSPTWQTRQFLLFRDLDEPDLWLGTDGHGRWGEINGAHRTDLDGGFDLQPAGSPAALAVPIRRLPVAVGEAGGTTVIDIDVDTLGATTRHELLRRLDTHRWSIGSEQPIEFEVDRYGLPLDIEGRFRRVS